MPEGPANPIGTSRYETEVPWTVNKGLKQRIQQSQIKSSRRRHVQSVDRGGAGQLTGEGTRERSSELVTQYPKSDEPFVIGVPKDQYDAGSEWRVANTRARMLRERVTTREEGRHQGAMRKIAKNKKDGNTTVTGADSEDVDHPNNESVGDYYRPATYYSRSGDWTFERQQSPQYLNDVYRGVNDEDREMTDVDYEVQGPHKGNEYPELEGFLGCGRGKGF
ncbi:MAG: hypothetical protein Q9225_001829 [Loekoesia sp. 1 TL-2023]